MEQTNELLALVDKTKAEIEELKLDDSTDSDQISSIILINGLKGIKAGKYKECVELLSHVSMKNRYNINQELKLDFEGINDKGTFWQILCKKFPKALYVWRYLLFRFGDQMIVASFLDSTPMAAATLYRRTELVRAIVSQTSDIAERAQSLKEYYQRWQRIQSECKLFITTMKEISSSNEFKTCMNVLLRALLKLIKNRRIFPRFIFDLVYLYQRDDQKGNRKSLWKQCELKLRRVLDIDTLYKSPLDWEFFKKQFMDRPFWLDVTQKGEEKITCPCGAEMIFHTSSQAYGIKCSSCRRNIDPKSKMYHCEAGKTREHEYGYFYCRDCSEKYSQRKDTLKWNDLMTIVNESMKKQGSNLENQFKGLIKSNEKAFAELIEFKIENKNFMDQSQMRQDMIENGVHVSVNERDLIELSLESKDYSFNALRLYDFSAYLTLLITRAQMINSVFVSKMESLYSQSDTPNTFRAGPVKTIKRCIAKSETEYANVKWPTSAKVIDVIRCSLTFEQIEDLNKGIAILLEFIKETKEEEEEKKKNPYLKLEVMRCKNMFTNMKEGKHFRNKTKRMKLPIPMEYRDIKMNVIISVWNDKLSKYESIVGEIQFLLKVMLDSKKRDHELYEIIRHSIFVEDAYRLGTASSFNESVIASNKITWPDLVLTYPSKFSKSEHWKTIVSTTGLKVSDLNVMFPIDKHKMKWKGNQLIHTVLLHGTPDILKEIIKYMRLANDKTWEKKMWRDLDTDGMNPFMSFIRYGKFDPELANQFIRLFPSYLLTDAEYIIDPKDTKGNSITILSIRNQEEMHLERIRFLKERVKDVMKGDEIETQKKWDQMMRAQYDTEIPTYVIKQSFYATCTPLMVLISRCPEMLNDKWLDLLVPSDIHNNPKRANEYWAFKSFHEYTIFSIVLEKIEDNTAAFECISKLTDFIRKKGGFERESDANAVITQLWTKQSNCHSILRKVIRNDSLSTNIVVSRIRFVKQQIKEIMQNDDKSNEFFDAVCMEQAGKDRLTLLAIACHKRQLSSELINELTPRPVKIPANQFWALQGRYGQNYLHLCAVGKKLRPYIVDDMELIKNHMPIEVWNELKSTEYSRYKDVSDIVNQLCKNEANKQALLDLLQ